MQIVSENFLIPQFPSQNHTKITKLLHKKKFSFYFRPILYVQSIYIFSSKVKIIE